MEQFVILDSEDSPLNACSVDFFQNVDDFIKQFELDKGLSSSKLLDSSDDSINQSSSSVDSLQDVNEFVKKLCSGLSSSILLVSSDETTMDSMFYFVLLHE